MDVYLNNYGFQWGRCLVERTCSNAKPEFYVLRVYAPNGEGVEIVMRPRSLKVKKFKKYVEKKRKTAKGER